MSYRPSLLRLRLRRRFVELVAAILFVAAISDRRSYAATAIERDPQAITLASQAVAAMSLRSAQGELSSPGTPASGLTDATLQGAANFTAGGDQESGSFTLELKGNEESKLVLALSGGTRQEIRSLAASSSVAAMSSSPQDAGGDTGATTMSSSPGAPQGAWSGADGVKSVAQSFGL